MGRENLVAPIGFPLAVAFVIDHTLSFALLDALLVCEFLPPCLFLLLWQWLVPRDRGRWVREERLEGGGQRAIATVRHFV